MSAVGMPMRVVVTMIMLIKIGWVVVSAIFVFSAASIPVVGWQMVSWQPVFFSG